MDKNALAVQYPEIIAELKAEFKTVVPDVVPTVQNQGMEVDQVRSFSSNALREFLGCDSTPVVAPVSEWELYLSFPSSNQILADPLAFWKGKASTLPKLVIFVVDI